MSPPSLVWRLPLLISIPWVQQVSSGTVSIRDRKRDVSSWRHFLYFVIPLGVVHSLRTRNFLGMNQLDRILGVFQQQLFVDPTFWARFWSLIAQHKLDRSTDRRQVRCLRILIPDEDPRHHLAIMTNRSGIRWINVRCNLLILQNSEKNNNN